MENIEARIARVSRSSQALTDYLAQVEAAKASGVPFDASFHWGHYARVRVMKRQLKPKSKRPLCGAKTRAGGTCKAKVCARPDGQGMAKRCRLHGGLSSGPKTQAGRDAIAESNRRRAAQRNADFKRPETQKSPEKPMF